MENRKKTYIKSHIKGLKNAKFNQIMNKIIEKPKAKGNLKS